MSIEAMTWALSVPVGGSEKVMLLGLANHAHPDGTEAYPSLDTLATYGACDRSTARRNVRKLAAAGWITAVGQGPRGTDKYTLNVGLQNATGGEMPRVALASQGGGTGASEGVAPMPPEPPMNRPRTVPVVVDACASAVTSEVIGALIAAGFDDLTIEQHRAAIGTVVAGWPADVDYFAVGVRVEAARRERKIKSPRPDSALKFIANSADGLPRIGMPAKAHRPLFGDRPLTADQRRHQRTRARIAAEGVHHGR